jgi:DNA helicase HerA-like ATPase
LNQFPAAALAQHIAVLGKTGSGKSYAVRGVVRASDDLF